MMKKLYLAALSFLPKPALYFSLLVFLFAIAVGIKYSRKNSGAKIQSETNSSSLCVKPKRATICLNMIVKNEEGVIGRCLDSVKPIIDHWIIVDTGSNDNTKELICQSLKGIPGQLYERPWVNFGANREEALQLAKDQADYVLFIDADDRLLYDKDFVLPELSEDFYIIADHDRSSACNLIRLAKTDVDWHWHGVLHELVVASQPTKGAFLQGVEYDYIHDGARSKDPKTYEKDAAILETALEKEPDNSRYVFYLGLTYWNMDNFEKAAKLFRQRVNMPGYDEEPFCSLWMLALIEEKTSKKLDRMVELLQEAHQKRPHRLEPIYALAKLARFVQDYQASYNIASQVSIAAPIDQLFVERWIYDYGMLYELALAACHCNHREVCVQSCQKLLAIPHLPGEERVEIGNLLLQMTK